MILGNGIPHVSEGPTQVSQLAGEEPDLVVGEPATLYHLAVGETGRQRARPIVEPSPFAPATRIRQSGGAGGERVPSAARADLPRSLHRKLERDDLHQPPGELGRLVGRVGLAHLDAVDERRRKQVQRDDSSVRLSRRQGGAVQRRVAVALAQPRTNTEPLPTTETPVTRDIASAASESSLALISTAPMLSWTTGARIRSIIWAAAVDDSASRLGADTVTCSAKTFDANDTATVASTRRPRHPASRSARRSQPSRP